MYPQLTDRQNSVVNYWEQLGFRSGFLDVSQSLGWRQLLPDHISCMASSAVYWNFGENEILTPLQMWNIQGLDHTAWPKAAIAETDGKVLKDLAANSFAVPCAGAFVIAVLCCIPLPESLESEAWLRMGGKPDHDGDDSDPGSNATTLRLPQRTLTRNSSISNLGGMAEMDPLP